MTEIWDAYDINGKLLNKTVKRDVGELQDGEYHLSVDVWIVNSNNQFLIQKRSKNKKIFPNMWESSAGGAVVARENSFQGCIRETKEELGIMPDMRKSKMVHKFIRNKNALMNVWLIKQDIDLKNIKLQKEEVSEVKWASLEEIGELLDGGTYVPTVIEGLEVCAKELGIK